MKKKNPNLYTLLIVVLLVLLFMGRGQLTPAAEQPTSEPTLSLVTAAPAAASPRTLDEDGSYTTVEDLVLYLQLYGRLPANFVRKSEARAAGWSAGALEPYMPGKCLGGDNFGNREGLLPDAPGRVWRECDVNTLGSRTRGPERLVYSNDGLIYYTDDHYETFTLLAGSP